MYTAKLYARALVADGTLFLDFNPFVMMLDCLIAIPYHDINGQGDLEKLYKT